jgi:hypothetical protein
MARRISNPPQGSARRSVSPNTGAGARSQTINGPQTEDEGAEPLSTSPRTARRFIESGAVGFGDSPLRRHRQSQINFFTIADVAERLHVSGRTVRRWIGAGDLVVHRWVESSGLPKAIYVRFWPFIAKLKHCVLVSQNVI